MDFKKRAIEVLVAAGVLAGAGCNTPRESHIVTYTPVYGAGPAQAGYMPLASDLKAAQERPFLSYLQGRVAQQDPQEQHSNYHNVPSPEEEALIRDIREQRKTQMFVDALEGFRSGVDNMFGGIGDSMKSARSSFQEAGETARQAAGAGTWAWLNYLNWWNQKKRQ